MLTPVLDKDITQVIAKPVALVVMYTVDRRHEDTGLIAETLGSFETIEEAISLRDSKLIANGGNLPGFYFEISVTRG